MKKIAILFLVFAGLAFFVYYYEIEGEKKREEARDAELSVFRVEREEISAVEVMRPEHPTVVLRREGESWVLKEPIETVADDMTVNSLITNINSARIDRTFEDVPLEEFGLQAPRLVLKVRAKESEKTLEIGKDDFTGSQVYGRFAGEPKVHLLPGSLFTAANKELMSWRSKKVLALQRDKVQAIEIQRPSGPLVFKKQEDQWLLQSPLQERADQGAVSSLLSSLEWAETTQFVTEKPDSLARYGLDAPLVTVRIQEAGTDRWKSLELGRREGEDYLARNADRTPVFTVKSEVYEKLTQEVWGFRDKDIIDVEQDQVAQMTIRRGEEELVLKREEMKWLIESPEALKGQEALSYKFWYPVEDIKFESIDERDNRFASISNPDVRIGVELKDGSRHTYEFARLGESYLGRKVESGREGRISREAFEKLQFTAEEITASSQ
jgi:hypothetical protein